MPTQLPGVQRPLPLAQRLGLVGRRRDLDRGRRVLGQPRAQLGAELLVRRGKHRGGSTVRHGATLFENVSLHNSRPTRKPDFRVGAAEREFGDPQMRRRGRRTACSGPALSELRFRYSLNFVPGRSVDTYLVALGALVQIEPVIFSPLLMILAAAPVEPLVDPVTSVRYLVPAGHLPVVFWAVYFSVTVVVPFPPFHVILVVRLPVILLIGTVTLLDPPAANAAGVHLRKVDATVPDTAVRLRVVVDDSFEHATCGGVAADAGLANGIASNAPAAKVSASDRVRTEHLICVYPSGDRTSF